MSENANLIAEIQALENKFADARTSIKKKFIGQDDVVDLTLISLLCGGHALLIGLPGLGKTRLVETLSTVMGLQGKRVQFTPDLMPADILGSEVLETSNDGTRSFRFIPGPIFCQLLMADEINRASPRTQSALLQAMQEKIVTIAGKDHRLTPPFQVLATQNPIELEGTYPLPEAQLDRFLVQINVNHPDFETERNILKATTGTEDSHATQEFSAEELIQAQKLLRKIPVGEEVLDFILRLVRAFRPEDSNASQRIVETVTWGPGPRASQALIMTARAHALLHGRLAPNTNDVIAMTLPVLSHRMTLNFAARARGDSLTELIHSTTSEISEAKVAA
ncbi:MAG: MoxR family ATPase [Aestuariivita sp.]|nr:MoxR family ATPase [Aestuariivita sp.]